MQRIKYATQCEGYKVFIGGSDNFRLKINPEYKANRKDVPRPEWLQQVREYLVTVHGAQICDNIEADDALGIHQDKEQGSTVIVSVDKDLLMIPGNHYNFVKDEHSTVPAIDGLRWFYVQLILGDRADNIFGYDGKARTEIPKFLQPKVDVLYTCHSEGEMYEHVLLMYKEAGSSTETMHMNAACLWIHQKEDDIWRPPA